MATLEVLSSPGVPAGDPFAKCSMSDVSAEDTCEVLAEGRPVVCGPVCTTEVVAKIASSAAAAAPDEGAALESDGGGDGCEIMSLASLPEVLSSGFDSEVLRSCAPPPCDLARW